jgi:hypothetical protein
MILRHMSFGDRYLTACRCPGSDREPSFATSRLQCWPSIFHDPHKMEVDFDYSVRAPPVFPYPRSLSGAQRAESRRLKARVLTLPVRDNKTSPVRTQFRVAQLMSLSVDACGEQAGIHILRSDFRTPQNASYSRYSAGSQCLPMVRSSELPCADPHRPAAAAPSIAFVKRGALSQD